MKTSKRTIPLLILLALVSLIGLQLLWLYFVYQYKAQELKDKTREAVFETTKRLQQEEDSKLILTSIDSLLVTDNIIGNDKKETIRVIVSNIKNKLKIDTLSWRANSGIEQKIKIVDDSLLATTLAKINGDRGKKVIIDADSSVSTTIVEMNNSTSKKITVKSRSFSSNTEKKAKDLEHLFLRMANESNDRINTVESRINFLHLKTVLIEELTKSGINITPEVIISSNLKELNNIQLLFPGMSTPNSNFRNYSFVSLPLFPNDLINNNILLEVGFKSTGNYLIKKMLGLLILSLALSLVIGFVIIYVFKRMLSQQKLHQLKNDFINNMTHELKTPIATISLALDAISNPSIKNNEEKFTNYTNILKSENKKLNSHVEHVLQMALIEQGQLELNKQKVNVILLLEACIKSHHLQTEINKAKIDFEYSEENISVEGDEFHLTNAFNNLLDNALKYSNELCEIVISVKKINNNVEIRFKDNGIGIAKEQQAKVFDKFYRVQGGNLHDVKGFGLGLSYVKSIIDAHNGNIELKSESNKGSEFIITL